MIRNYSQNSKKATKEDNDEEKLSSLNVASTLGLVFSSYWNIYVNLKV